MGSCPWDAQQLQERTKLRTFKVKGCLQSPWGLVRGAKGVWTRIIAAGLTQRKPCWKEHNKKITSLCIFVPDAASVHTVFASSYLKSAYDISI